MSEATDDQDLGAATISATPTSQFGLLGTRRLAPLFVTQFFGAFNDNLFKQAFIVILTFGGLVAADETGIYVNFAAGLFILPFFLFSATAGTLADKFEKSRLIRFVKIGEIGVAALAGIALYLGSATALFTVLFLLGVQSTFFGPLKYAILPQHLDARELVGGNAMVQMERSSPSCSVPSPAVFSAVGTMYRCGYSRSSSPWPERVTRLAAGFRPPPPPRRATSAGIPSSRPGG